MFLYMTVCGLSWSSWDEDGEDQSERYVVML